MRARYPDHEGFVERDGVKVGYEVFGTGEPAVVFPPIDAIVHSRAWKAQVPYLARTSKVVTIDPRGNGRSGRPQEAAAYADTEFVADTIAVMDAAGIDHAVLVGICTSGWRALLTAALHPGRVLGVVALATIAPFLAPPLPTRAAFDFDQVLSTDEGWAKENRHYWLRDWQGYAEFFFGELLPEPHSTKQHADCVGWAMEIGPETMLVHDEGPQSSSSREETEALLRRVRCPVLAIHGREDRCEPVEFSERVAALTGGELLLLDGAGHLPNAREPVIVNRVIRDFANRFRPRPAVRRVWTRPLNRPKRVLYISSPIGLGHARRDLAIADELRALRPGLEVHWLAQHPVTELLERRSERIHPASAFLASESGHIESEADEHDLHAFQAIREMDEILISNFMVFADLVADEPFDLWVGDEAWDVDYFLHENPELKRTAYAWLTDFVGWLPMPDGGAPERALTTDYNAEMIEQIARFPRLRDRAIFVGNAAGRSAGQLRCRAAADQGLGPAELPVFRVPAGRPADGPVQPGRAARRAWLPARRKGLRGHGGRLWGGDRTAPPGHGGLPDGEETDTWTADDRGGRATHRSRVPAVSGRPRGTRLRARSPPASGRLRSRRRPGRADHHDGAHRRSAAVHLRAVASPLRAELPCPAPPGAVRRRRRLDYADLVPDLLARAMADEIARPVSYRPVEQDGAARAAALLAELI